MAAFRKIVVLVAALCWALIAGASIAGAQTITNTAAATWMDRGNSFTTVSNTVAITLKVQPVTVETFKLLDDGEQALTFTPAECGGEQIVFPAGAVSTSVSSLERTNQVHIGDVLFFRFTAPSANLDPAQIDSISAVLMTTAGDREAISIYETDPASGAFVGAILTTGVPPQPVHGDCRLSVAAGDHVSIEASKTGNKVVLAKAEIEVLADPFGLIFDSENGSTIDGASISLVDAATGAPARVYSDDGVTRWPSTVISGATVIDAAGQAHPMQPGEYRFPFTLLGSYRLVVTPPAPYSAPSEATAEQLADLRRPDGLPFTIIPASFGESLTLAGPSPVRVDVPLDSPPVAVEITKSASRASALPGDAVFFTVTLRNPDPRHSQRGVVLADVPGAEFRLRRDSIRVDGVAVPSGVNTAPDGRRFTIAVGNIAPGASRVVTYAMAVRADANAGQAANVATATDVHGTSATASTFVQVEREDMGARTTLLGRIVAGGCDVKRGGAGVAGVRLVLEDGSFAITDADGRYHFEGVGPGSHVVQAIAPTLPAGSHFVDCARSTRSAGSPASRFVSGQGGQVLVADFYVAGVIAPPPQDAKKTPNAKDQDMADERAAAGADADWLKLGDGPTDFLFPTADHNPRAPAVRVAVRHRVTEKVELLVDGKPIDPVAFDGTSNGPGGTFAVSLWRGVPLDGEVTHLSAVVRTERGALIQTLKRDVHFAATPARIEILPAQSRLVADGSTRPIVALRVLDRAGRPVHAGLSGEFSLAAPYESAEAVAAMQARALAGQGRGATRWLVKGDDGIAYVELAPTMVSGKLHMEFQFVDGQQHRRQQIDTWLVPGKQPWMVTGLAEGTAGARDIADAMQRSTTFDSDLGRNARVAIYAKGPVAQSVLLTVAYDSAKQRAEQQLMGAIDPRAYYTVFADGSDRRFDAASREKLYLRVEGRGLNAVYGDFEAGFDQTQLARYVRTATGLRGELSRGGFHAAGFAARIASSHRHDEFQGGGVSGPYRLSSRAIIAGSEVVSIEVRDRFRSEVIVSRRALVRFVDYELDRLSGTITFKESVLSRDPDLNPQFVVMDYELDETARGGDVNAGVRGDYTIGGGKLRIGASAVTDTSANAATRTSMGALDLRAQVGENTEIRAEAGMSVNAGNAAVAWLVEAEHHTDRIDLLAYARLAEREFGLGQNAGAERGRRKFGLDARYQVNEALSLTASTWDDAGLTDHTHRSAVQLGALYRTQRRDARIGIATMHDTLGDGATAASTVLEGGVTQRLLDNRLEIGASSSIAIGQAESADLPERHRLTLRYAVRSNVRLVGSYEIANGAKVDTRTARAGVEVSPWQGARVTTGLGQQATTDSGKRAFAAFGLAQSFDVTRHLTLDGTLDSSRTIGGASAAALASGGKSALGGGGTVTDDFTAVTLGASWRDERWNLIGRGEWRDGELSDNKGLRLGAIRQLGDGSMLGSSLTWTRANGANGAATGTVNGAVALARRPADSSLAMLAKLELRSDHVTNAATGQVGPVGGGALTVAGDARSVRAIGSVAVDWSPYEREGADFARRSEVSLFGAVRHNLDRVEGYDLAGTTLLGGVDARYGFGPHLELGARGTVRASLADSATNFSFGPELGISPADDVLLIVGYNIAGYRDRDFSAAQNTDRGLYASVRLKIDADTFGFLGTGR